ncbi:MAG: hypothetical protein V7645_611 [Actinomycetota bacterium]
MARHLLIGRTRWCLVIAVAALLVPPSASAHIRSATIATDYRTRVFALPAPLHRVLATRIYQSDRAIRLMVADGHTAVIFGYLHEPFVRVTATGVEVNASAPTAGGAGLLARLPLRSTGWHRLSKGRSVTWHDNRVRALPRGIDRVRWRIPLVVDGTSTRLEGELWRVRAPAWWPWLVMGVPFVLISLLLYLRRRSAVRAAAAAFGLGAAAGLVASGAGFAFDTYASNGKWVELGNELALVLVGIAVIARGSPGARGIAGGGLGLLGLGVGVTQTPVLLHGVVLSIFSSDLARALVTLTIWSGTAATVLGLVVYEDLLGRTQEPAES